MSPDDLFSLKQRTVSAVNNFMVKSNYEFNRSSVKGVLLAQANIWCAETDYRLGVAVFHMVTALVTFIVDSDDPLVPELMRLEEDASTHGKEICDVMSDLADLLTPTQ